MLGFMIVSSLLSMWISNTATTAMMLPIAQAVLQQLRATEERADKRDFETAAEHNEAFELEISQTKQEIKDQPDTKAQLEDSVCK